MLYLRHCWNYVIKNLLLRFITAFGFGGRFNRRFGFAVFPEIVKGYFILFRELVKRFFAFVV